MSIETIIKNKRKSMSKDSFTLDTKRKDLIERVKQLVVEKREFGEGSFDEKLASVKKTLYRLIDDETSKNYKDLLLTSYEKIDIIENIVQSMFGYGVIEPYIDDEEITEIMVNGTESIFIEKEGIITKLTNSNGQNLRFTDSNELIHVIDKIVSPINRKVDQSDPIVDARLPNGSRVNIVLPPASLDGAAITIRKFPKNPYTMDDLIKKGSVTTELSDFFYELVKARFNIVVSGGTGSGKTTFLNALSSFIPSNSRLITVEDSAELQIKQIENLIRMETRPPNIEGKGEITIRDLVKTSLRMRPDRIVVGEVRGGEALDMLQAMNTGHDGSLTTGHANSALDMLSRLETMVLMAGIDLPLKSIRQQIVSAVDIIVHLKKFQDGKRRINEIVELVKLSDDEYEINQLAEYDHKTGKMIIKNNLQLINSDKFKYTN